MKEVSRVFPFHGQSRQSATQRDELSFSASRLYTTNLCQVFYRFLRYAAVPEESGSEGEVDNAQTNSESTICHER